MVLFSIAAVRTTRRRADARVAEAVQRLADGMQDTMRELAEALSEAQAAGRQASLGSAETELDFDDVAKQALAAVAAVPGVDSALLETVGPSGRVVSRAARLSAADAGAADIEMPVDERLRAVEVEFGL